MSKPTKAKEKAQDVTATDKAPAKMTGVAYTVQASKDTGSFANYRICTLFFVDGDLVHVEKSQEYAAFEAIARTEIFVNSSLWALSSRYQHGEFQTLGGDQRDELVNRLKKKDPALLRKIAPALGMTAEQVA